MCVKSRHERGETRERKKFACFSPFSKLLLPPLVVPCKRLLMKTFCFAVGCEKNSNFSNLSRDFLLVPRCAREAWLVNDIRQTFSLLHVCELCCWWCDKRKKKMLTQVDGAISELIEKLLERLKIMKSNWIFYAKSLEQFCAEKEEISKEVIRREGFKMVWVITIYLSILIFCL